MTELNEIFSERTLKHYQEMDMANDISLATLEFLFTQRYTAHSLNGELKLLEKDWTKEQNYMFWFKLKSNLKNRLQILLNSVKYYGLKKKPDDLLGDTFEDVPEISRNNDDLLDDRFQNITEKTLRREIEKMIEEDRYDKLMMLQDKVMFDCCAMSIGKWMDEHNEKPRFEGNPKGLQYRLAFFNLLMEYQNKMSGGQELETEVIIKRKGT